VSSERVIGVVELVAMIRCVLQQSLTTSPHHNDLSLIHWLLWWSDRLSLAFICPCRRNAFQCCHLGTACYSNTLVTSPLTLCVSRLLVLLQLLLLMLMCTQAEFTKCRYLSCDIWSDILC